MAGKMTWEEMLASMNKKDSGKKEKKEKTVDPNIYVLNWDKTPDPTTKQYPTTRKLIRPFCAEGDLPFVTKVTHGFKLNGQWYIGACRQFHTKVNGSCPVCDYIYKNNLWDKMKEKKNKFLGRKYEHFTNILVRKDALSPDQEGQVKILNYKNEIKKIFDMAMNPIADEFDDKKEAFIPWHTDKAYDIKLVITPKLVPNEETGEMQLFPRYDKSEYQKEYSSIDLNVYKPFDLNYLIDLKNEFTQEQQFARFNKVMGIKSTSVSVPADFAGNDNGDTIKDNVPADSKVEDDSLPPPGASEDGDDDFVEKLRRGEV